MISLGIDIGYSSVKIVVFDEQLHITDSRYVLHKGHPRVTLLRILEELRPMLETEELCGAVVGSGGNFLTSLDVCHPVNDIAAAMEGSMLLAPDCASVIEIGGQRAGFITGFSEKKKTGIEFSLNPDCSAGTGSFLEEQVSRIGVDIESYSQIESKALSIPRIAGRCSVFAKTDITHHQQEGVGIPDILRGLAYATARNYRNAVMRGLPLRTPVFFAGGVSQNKAIFKALLKVLVLDEEQFFAHKLSRVSTACGAAVIALKDGMKIDFERLMDAIINPLSESASEDTKTTLPALYGVGHNDAENKHFFRGINPNTDLEKCWIGVDVGSTSTNVVLIDSENRVMGFRYLRTAGDPVEAVKKGLSELGHDLGSHVKVAGVGVTGSGRYMTGRLIGADVVKDEITSQARAAVSLYPDVDTVFEIGGQDSKFISIKNGVVFDFQMNKVCAAGTGSFIEEQAKKIGLELDDYAATAFKSEAPINLGERCTVFMETSIASHLAMGDSIEDIAAGLCYSIVKNYTNRVVGRKKIGSKVLLQGGVAYNQAIVNAFRLVTGKEIVVPPFFSVTGALGVAILAREEMQSGISSFKGFLLEDEPAVRAEPAHNKFASGSFNRDVQEFIFRDYDGTVEPSKKTVGMPRALFTYGMYPMFYPFFKALGVNVVLSEPTSGETIRLAQEYSLDETCYPVKLINGHAAELVERKVDYLFFPNLYTASHPSSKSRQNYGCPYMQLAFKIINEAMDLEARNIKLLAPTIAFNQGAEFMNKMFMALGSQIGKSSAETAEALSLGMKSYNEFKNRMEERGKDTLKSLDPNAKSFVLISKIYGVADPVLNMGIPDKLAEMGYRTIPLYDLPESDIFMEHPNMFWPFGQHMLAAAKLVAKHPNLYPIFLTHHGCGPDTVFSHYYSEILKDKSSLTIEVDEHSSSVGVLTRVEAFVNSLSRIPLQPALSIDDYIKMSPAEPVNIITQYTELSSRSVYLPNIYPYSSIACAALKSRGIDAHVLASTSSKSLDLGRKYSSGNEYFSFTALLGDVLTTLPGCGKEKGRTFALFIPQNEGAEVDGQYSRLLRSILDQEGLDEVEIISPYLEDLKFRDEQSVNLFFLCLLAGDLVLHTPKELRAEALEFVLNLIKFNELSIEKLEIVANTVLNNLVKLENNQTILAIGEPMILFNEVLNDCSFSRLEKSGVRVIYAPLSEYLWNYWYDYYTFNKVEAPPSMRRNIAVFQEYMERISGKLGKYSHYEKIFGSLKKTANMGLGYYSGAFGRYRGAKIVEEMSGVKGVISVSSMYENTGISLGILKDRMKETPPAPVLSLTFDGNMNENNRIKVDSFIYNV
ncbi:acyl-CoA dehydratase activase [Desulfovibrio sp. UCD-KL4C]|uniref:acyl-CoA dehydratase activase n=1 Tax=Desulfovibrio sp. UCD-KL4C TaxID=2578120 RepID=UPI0025BA0C7C|nr:acyl-CoA dehydratase activase [Desulfovibrio sp. UCD-KL4C]